MLKPSHSDGLDEVDRAILRALQASGNLSNADLARQISLSPAATHTRVRRLEAQGLIKQYTVLLDREKLGFDLVCFVQVTIRLHQPELVREFPKTIGAMPEVLECYHVTGECDYLLKVITRNRTELKQFLVDKLTGHPAVGRIQTSVVLDESKHTTELTL